MPNKIVALSFCFLAALCLQSAAVEIPSTNAILTSLSKGHPRLLAHASDFEKLKAGLATNESLRGWQAAIEREGEKVLTAEPSRYEIPDGLRLLSTSRRVLYRVYTLGLLYQLHHDKKFSDRAWRELAAAANFPDWNPRHFLDTAEMTHAFAIGYDWLDDAWTPEQKKVLRDAIVSKGLRVGLAGYRGENKFGGWAKARHNWNQVCNGGLGVGALAIADEEPELASQILKFACESLQIPMREFAPDGAWAEGPGYWSYATSYNVMFLAALNSALGTDFGLSQIPGLDQTGTFPIYLTGPLGRTFNYADGGDGRLHAPQLFWLAKKFHQPAFGRYEANSSSPHPLDLLWASQLDVSPAAPLPLDKYFRNAEVVTFRSAWDDANALFVGFKAGDNKANHSHLDLGTFVLDALGKRWAIDLGADDYNLPNYFGKSRWEYYRLRAEGHNVPVLDPGREPDQSPAAAAKIIAFKSEPARVFAIADLTAAYEQRMRRAQRGLAMLDRKMVLIQDEFEPTGPADLWWFFHTTSEVQISADRSTAILRQGEARLSLKILSPAQAVFEQLPAAPMAESPHPSRQAENNNIRKVAIHLPIKDKTSLAVLAVPVGQGGPPTLLKVRPLSEW